MIPILLPKAARRLLLVECRHATQPYINAPDMLTVGRLFSPPNRSDVYLLGPRRLIDWIAVRVSRHSVGDFPMTSYWNFKSPSSYTFYDSLHVL